jgi:hypothetical protein
MNRSLSFSNPMKKNDTKHFLYRNGNFYPVASNDRSIQYWDADAQEYPHHAILSVKIYKKDLHVSDSYRKKYKEGEKEIKKRGVIKKYSFGASRRCILFFRNTRHLMEYTIGLTYPNSFPMDGLLVKKQLHKFLGWLRYHGYRYLWVLEFQIRHAPHFHFLIDKYIDEEKVRKYWYELVNSGDTKHLKRGAKVEPIRSKGGVAHYMTGYLEKDKQKVVPPEYQKVGRFWGHSDGLLEENKMKIYGSYDDIKKLKNDLKIAKQFERAQKRLWRRRDKARGINRKKLKREKSEKPQYDYHGYLLRLVNSDRLYDELLRREVVLWPYKLIDIPPVPTATSLEERWDGRSDISKKDMPHNLKLDIETYKDYIKRLGLY